MFDINPINAANTGKVFGKMFVNSRGGAKNFGLKLDLQIDRQTEPPALTPHNTLHQFTQSCSRAASFPQ